MKQDKEHPTLPSLDQFLAKIERIRASGGVDLSTAEDLSLAVMNLISLEEHFFFTAMKTKKDEYFDTGTEVREMRKGLLRELMPEHEGETWCASKHLLAATMRLIEVGNKLQSDALKEKATEAIKAKKAMAAKTFEKAYKVYSIFWALKTKLVGVRALADFKATSFEDLMNQLSDCCNE